MTPRHDATTGTDGPPPTLDYEPPRRRTTRSSFARMDYALTLAFAVFALLLATFSAVKVVDFLERSRTLKGTAFRDDAREDAYRMFAIAAVCGVPGVWYGRVAIRGLRRGD